MAMSKTYRLVESTDQATHYYLIPQHKTIIPKCSNSQRVLITLLSSHRDIHSPTMVSEYPIVTRTQANMFGWIAMTVKVHYLKHVTPQDAAREAYELSKKKWAQFLQDSGIDVDSL